MENKQQNAPNRNIKLPGMRGPRGTMEVEKPKDGMATLKRLALYFSKEKKNCFFLLLAVLLVVVCSIVSPKLQSDAIDCITRKEFGDLFPILVMMAIFYGISCIGSLFQGRCSAYLSQRIVEHLRRDLFHSITELSIEYSDTHSHGDLMSRMTNDVENISNTVSQSMSSLFSGVLTVIGTVGMMFYLCPRLALLSCLTVIMTVVATKYMSKAMKLFYRRRQAVLGQLNGTVEEMVTGFRTVAAFQQEEEVIRMFEKSSDELTKVGIKAEILGGSMGPVMNAINNISFVIIAAFGGYFAYKGIITVGVISAFIVYAKQFGRPIDELAQIWGQIQTAIAGSERVFSVMDEPKEDKSGSLTMDDAEGIVTFEHVNFSYVPGKPVLQDFNLTVKAGQKVALVGATGSGKTTVVNLLMRFYNVDSGRICIDGMDIMDIDCRNLRKNTAIVLQDTVLFSDTVRNNIAYSRMDASDAEVEEAARQSHCTSLIRGLRKGYDTVLKGGGQGLSQGQRQLLTIARAFLARPRILILDEATSNVDTRTEKRIQNAMTSLMKNRTSLVIAHRLSTIQDADVIVVLEQGRIAETGDHESLLAQKGKYYELYMTQFAGQAI